MRARLLRGVGANLYAQGVTSLIQLAAVPVLVRLWGPASYGVWTLLSAVPAALAFTDGGLVLATGTAMTMAVARHDTAGAAGLFRRACRTVGLATLGVALVACLVATFAPFPDTVATLGGSDTRDLLLCFALITLVGLLGTLPGAAFRADGRYARGTALGATARAAEMLAVLIAAAITDGLVAPALTWLAVRGAGVAVQFALAGWSIAWLRPSQPAGTPHLAPLLRPALAAVAIPAAFAVSLQGVTVAVGLVLSHEAVAAFTAARTLSRLIVQGAGLVNHALMPEMSCVAGRRDGAAAAAALLRVSRVAALALLLPGWVGLLVLGPRLLAAWTGGRLTVPPGVLPLVSTAALVHGLWLARANLLLAVNRQGDYAWVFLATAALTAAAAVPCGYLAGLGGVATASLAGEVVMALWLVHIVWPRPVGTVALAGGTRP